MSITDNPISIQLATDESVTVPDGEIWRVSVGSGDNSDLVVNGVEVISSNQGYWSTYDTVFVEGDKIEQTDSRGVHIGGFVL